MNKHWHYLASTSLAAALFCLFLVWRTGDQGQHTFELFGSQFGLARSKAMTFVVWRDELWQFPFDRTLFTLAWIGISVATAITWHHFRTIRKEG